MKTLRNGQRLAKIQNKRSKLVYSNLTLDQKINVKSELVRENAVDKYCRIIEPDSHWLNWFVAKGYVNNPTDQYEIVEEPTNIELCNILETQYYEIVGYVYGPPKSCSRDICLRSQGVYYVYVEQWFYQILDMIEEEEEALLGRYTLENEELEIALLAA